MLNHFQKLFLFFSLSSALQIYAMETNSDDNQQSLYNPEANAKLLHIINTLYENTIYEDRLATQKDWKNIIKCLENGANPNLKGNDNLTILQTACLEPYDKKIKEYLHSLLKHGADPNIGNNSGWKCAPVLMLLRNTSKNPQNFDPEMLEILLKYNANPHLPFIFKAPDTQEDYSVTPLNFAAGYGNEDVVKILLKHGADINAKSPFYFDDGIHPIYSYSITPLARAVVFDESATIKILCRKGASLNAPNAQTVLGFAVKELKYPESPIKNIIVNTRFQLPTTEKKLDSIALELLLILKNQFKFQIPEELKFRILAILPALQNWAEPDSTLYKKLFHTNYREPYLFARLMCHIQNIQQILHEKDGYGKTAFSRLAQNEKTKKILPQLYKDIEILLQSNRQEILPDNLALQICTNYEELLEEEQAQNIK